MRNRQLWGQLVTASSSRLIQVFQQSVSSVAGLLFPPVCTVCGGEFSAGLGDLLVCVACRDEIVDRRPACDRCARPLPTAVCSREDCPACRQQGLRFARTTALGVYGGLLREVVIRVKQAGQDPLALSLAQLLAERHLEGERPDFIVPVPMHWLRRLSRGSNCPEVLSEVLSSKLRVPMAGGLLRCRRQTKKQGTLLPTERQLNVRGAYRVSEGYDITGANVLIVDDVMTTGATGNEIAKVLHRAGAKSVSLTVIARGIGF